jgi:hypothetical protein
MCTIQFLHHTTYKKSLPTTSSQHAQKFFDFAVAELAWLQLIIQVIKYNYRTK